MKHTLVQAALVAVVLTLAACGPDDAGTTAADRTQDPVSNGAEPTASAATGEAVTRLWIKPDLVDCIGEAEQKCMQVAEAVDGEYLFFYDEIAGFEFVEGTSYVIDVRIDEIADPPADGSSLAYTLVELVQADRAADQSE